MTDATITLITHGAYTSNNQKSGQKSGKTLIPTKTQRAFSVDLRLI